MTLKLPRLSNSQPDWGAFQIWWQQVVTAIEAQEGRQDEAIAAIEAAQAAATAANTAAATAQAAANTANTAATTITAETSLVNSYPENYTGALLSAASSGVVTIANHDRHYGDGTVVSVTGGTVSTGLSSSDVARIYYDQPSRAGGSVTYQSTNSDTVAVQSGDRHVIGAVTIPGSGSVDGKSLKPVGYVEP